MPYIELPFEQTLKLGPEDVPEGPKRQGGVRFPTLCRNCNNGFGGSYARAFIEWCYQGMYILERSGGNPKLVYAHRIFPLRVIKEIIAMFFSVNSEKFRETPIGKELAWLLLNKEEKGLPPEVRFYAYFNVVGQFRYLPISSLANFENGTARVFSEITYPPFGYVMSFQPDAPDSRLFDITHFAQFDYENERSIFLDLPVLPTYMGNIPGDYRKLEEINKQAQESDRLASGEADERPVTVDDQIRLLEAMLKAQQLHSRFRG